MITFAVLSLVLATMKLPYVLLVGLLLFIPKEKMEVKKNYLYAALLIFVTAILSFLSSDFAPLSSINSWPMVSASESGISRYLTARYAGFYVLQRVTVL